MFQDDKHQNLDSFDTYIVDFQPNLLSQFLPMPDSLFELVFQMLNVVEIERFFVVSFNPPFRQTHKISWLGNHLLKSTNNVLIFIEIFKNKWWQHSILHLSAQFFIPMDSYKLLWMILSQCLENIRKRSSYSFC